MRQEASFESASSSCSPKTPLGSPKVSGESRGTALSGADGWT